MHSCYPAVVLPHGAAQLRVLPELHGQQPSPDQLAAQAGLSLPVQTHRRLVWLLPQRLHAVRLEQDTGTGST